MTYVKKIKYYNLFLYCYRNGHTGQSVSNEGRKRHADDSEYISRRLLSYYNRYCLKQDQSGSLLQSITTLQTDPSSHPASSSSAMPSSSGMMFWFISELCIWHIRALLSFNISRESYRNIKKFESYVHKKNIGIYDSLNNRFDIRMLRKGGYCGYIACHIIAWGRNLILNRSVTGSNSKWKEKLWNRH